MSAGSEQFDDPQLKAAIVRAKGEHTARPGLRDQITQRLIEEGLIGRDTRAAHVKTHAKTSHWYLAPRVVALAATLLIALGSATMYVRHVRYKADEREEYLEANRPVLLAMISAHNTRGADGTVSAGAKEMATQLKRDVPSVNLAGWTIDSTSVCKVGDIEAGYWHLSRDGKNISVLSLPASQLEIEAGDDEYDVVVDQHAIAGFVRNGSINCVVCDPGISAEESIKLRDELKRG